MAFQVLNQPGTVGQGIGLGLTSGLQALANQKLAQVQQQNERNQLAQLLMQQPNPLSAAQAQLVAQLPVNQRFEALQGIIPAGIQQQPVYAQSEPTQTAIAQEQQAQPLRQAQAGNKPRTVGQFELGQEVNKQLTGLPEGQINPADMIKQLQSLTGQKPNPQQVERVREIVNDLNTNPEARKQLENDYAKAVASNQMVELRRPNYFGPAVPYEQALQQMGQPIFQKPLSTADKIAAERLEISKRKEQRINEKNAREETQKYREDIHEKARSAKKKLRDLTRLDELENEGLESAGYYEFLKRSGFDIPALMNPASQEYDKIATGFIREAGQTFKGKVSNYEADLFLKLIPSLSMSPEGRKRVRAMIKNAEYAELAEEKALNEVIAKYGYLNRDLMQELVDEKVDNKIEQLSLQFKKDLSKPVPESQNPLTTAIQAGLGELTAGAKNALPGAIKGAAKGAIIGSVVPGVGTKIGAGLGIIGGATGLL